MNILITGISGFIGFHTALHFNNNHNVYGFDNLNDYYDVSLKKSRKDILSQNKIHVETLDLLDYDKLNEYISKTKPDLVIHLAAMAGVRHSLENEKMYIDNNIIGTHNLIKTLENNNIKNVIYASTSCVMHGNPLPWKEYESLGPHINPYGYSKAVNESQFHMSKIPNAVGLRFFTVYGPWGRPDMALFLFTKNIIENVPINVYNNGNMQRDFTYISDIVNGIDLISKNLTNRDIYCIGSGTQVNLTDFINEIEVNLNKKGTYSFQPKHPADVLSTCSDVTKIGKLGYNPSVNIENGIKNFIRWYTSYYCVKV